MTPAASLLDPASNSTLYIASVLTIYVDLPDTPLRANAQDQRQARIWFERGVSLSLVETALLLASLRRATRQPGAPPLSRIRSLAYFEPVIDELLENPVPNRYLDYLRLKLRAIADRAEPPANVQKTTLSDDR